ncbi:MAG: hypothetical protein KBS59_06615 [Clostridiales bacterium]|nr:hypothetical protein [Clostridiales bacterium]
MPTQTEEILCYMETFGSITQLEALSEFGCMRLASRINDLKKAGYPIGSRFIKRVSRNGRTVKFSEYYLERNEMNA